MSATPFPHLFSPIDVGGYALRSRIVCTGHATAFHSQGLFTDRHLHYYEARARGGAGMIITEAVGVDPTSILPLSLHHDAIVPMLGKIAAAVHGHDVPILAQLSHAGRRVSNPVGAPESVAVAPSAIPSPGVDFGQMMPHELSTEEVEGLVQAFGAAAARVRKAGMDGVEVSIAFGNLIPQFLSEDSNRRTDRYGGTPERRLTFAYEVIDEVRRSLGSDLLLGVRFTEDFLEYGLDLEDLRRIAPALAATGKLDYVSVAAGTNYGHKSATHIIPSHYLRPAQFDGLAHEVKNLVGVPVIGVGRINSPSLAEELLAEGRMDLVGMARELIADPDLPNKARSGRVGDIRPCVACNQSCKGHQERGVPITCIYNPVSGRESDRAELASASSAKRVVVVGGGPAGMEAARVAAERGHTVTLFEKSDRLGGQINIAAAAPNRQEFGEISLFLEGQLARLGVEIRRGVKATADMVTAESPDAVVVATGSTPFRPAIPGADGGTVVTDREVFEAAAAIGERVVVIDTQGLRQACDVANHLALEGRIVEVITGLPYIGHGVQAGIRLHLHEELLGRGVVISPFTGVRKITEWTVETYNTVYTDLATERVIEGVDTVVLASGGRADDSLYRALQGKVGELYTVGDCLQPRDVEAAVYEGHKAGRAL